MDAMGLTALAAPQPTHNSDTDKSTPLDLETFLSYAELPSWQVANVADWFRRQVVMLIIAEVVRREGIVLCMEAGKTVVLGVWEIAVVVARFRTA